jgi:hemolysin D
MTRTLAVCRDALAEDRKRSRVGRNRNELEFLPAAVEILETPASPAGRAILWLILLVFVVTVTLAYFGHIDTVAVAQGKIIPGGRVKTVQSLEMGVVRAIHVRDGQKVEAGELLVELDPTDSDADRERIGSELMAARIDVARALALTLVDGDPVSAFHPPIDADASLLAASRAHLRNTVEENRARLAVLDSRLAELAANEETVVARIEKLSATIPLLKERADAHEELMNRKVAARVDFLELKQQLVEMQQDRTIELRQLNAIQVSKRSVKEQRAQAEAEMGARANDELVKMSRQVIALSQELRKAEERQRLRQLRAPVGGIVQQLSVHTIGGVVSPAQPVLVVVPEGSPLEVEAFILNKDVGFVEAEQPVEIKIESFPFTKYGLIHGQVVHVSADSVENEDLGFTYPARVAMHEDKIRVQDRWVKLGPGMAVTVEVKTGRRRVIEFFLSPFLRYQDEAMKER